MTVIEKEINTIFDGKTVVSLKVYSSAQEVLEAWLGVPLNEAERIGGWDGKGGTYDMPTDEVLSNVKESGCWGFCGVDKKTIHVWADKDCEMANLVHFFAHERGHTLRPWKRNEDLEEVKAEKYGDTARFAYESAVSLKAMLEKGDSQ